MDSLQQIKDVSARWVARRHASEWTASDEAELEAWLNASVSHRVEYLRHEKTWRDGQRLKVLGVGVHSGAAPRLEDWQASPYFKHVRKQADSQGSQPAQREGYTVNRWFAGVAASLLIAGTAVYFALDRAGGSRYSTSIGMVTAVPLADGSKLILNTNSKIRVALSEQARKVELEQGEVYFDVVPDSDRPFVVDTGSKRIVVLGTKFSVRRDGDDIRVIVTEGKVRLGDDGEVLSAGAVAQTHNVAVDIEQRPLPKAEALLSWRSGYLLFDEVTLAEAVAEFNRYNTQQLVIQDPEIARIPVTGHFRSTSVEPFARLLHEGFPVKVIRQEDKIILKAP